MQFVEKVRRQFRMMSKGWIVEGKKYSSRIEPTKCSQKWRVSKMESSALNLNGTSSRLRNALQNWRHASLEVMWE
jgi:hypothetical protein